MKKISRDRIASIVVLAVGIFYLVMTLTLKRDMSSVGDPGPKIFPLIASVGLIVCAIIMFFESKDDLKPFLSRAGWIKVSVVMLMLVLYVLGLKYLGFLISTPFVLFGMVSMFMEDKAIALSKRILFSLLATVIIYVVFVKLLDTILPRGIFYF